MRKPETVFELSIDGPLDLKRNIGETECLIFYQDSTGQLVARSAVSLDTAAFLWQKFLQKEQKEALKDIRYARIWRKRLLLEKTYLSTQRKSS